jgi:hypothetical protein
MEVMNGTYRNTYYLGMMIKKCGENASGTYCIHHIIHSWSKKMSIDTEGKPIDKEIQRRSRRSKYSGNYSKKQTKVKLPKILLKAK